MSYKTLPHNISVLQILSTGLTWEEAHSMCPEGVVPACHNAEDSVTISGPAESVGKFVQELKAKDIFAREVQSSGVAFHSYYMNEIAPTLKQALDKVNELYINFSAITRCFYLFFILHEWHFGGAHAMLLNYQNSNLNKADCILNNADTLGKVWIQFSLATLTLLWQATSQIGKLNSNHFKRDGLCCTKDILVLL